MYDHTESKDYKTVNFSKNTGAVIRLLMGSGRQKGSHPLLDYPKATLRRKVPDGFPFGKKVTPVKVFQDFPTRRPENGQHFCPGRKVYEGVVHFIARGKNAISVFVQAGVLGLGLPLGFFFLPMFFFACLASPPKGRILKIFYPKKDPKHALRVAPATGYN